MNALDELASSIFDSKQTPLAHEFESWVRDSRRFRAFAVTYRIKIRAKLKNVRDAGGMQDVRAELETAALLLHNERFTLEYEKYAASKQRGPDFTVTYKTHTPFNVEVRRIRNLELDEGDAAARIGKVMAVLCDKVGQMPPSIVNLLWLHAERELSHADLTGAVMSLRQLAERKENEFFTRCGFESAAAFLKQYPRLSGIILRRAGENIVWLNPIAKHKVQPEIVNAIQRLTTI